jgi:hypothetical protein
MGQPEVPAAPVYPMPEPAQPPAYPLPPEAPQTAYPPPPAAPPPVYPPPPAGLPPVYPPQALPAPATPAVAAQAPAPAESAKPGKYGAGIDLGISGVLPDFGLLATWRPYAWLHAQAGLAYNIISPGIRCGATVINPWFVPISLTGELGHFFEGNANGMIKSLTGQDSDIAVLRKVSYSYANALVGFTSGGQHFVYYVRAGFTRMWATLNNFDETVSKMAGSSMETSDAKLSYFGPTLKTGMLVLF